MILTLLNFVSKQELQRMDMMCEVRTGAALRRVVDHRSVARYPEMSRFLQIFLLYARFVLFCIEKFPRKPHDFIPFY